MRPGGRPVIGPVSKIRVRFVVHDVVARPEGRLPAARPTAADDVNVPVGGVSCDMVYYDAKLIVMLDGVGNHRSRAPGRRDLADAFALASRAGIGGTTSGS
jgi:hypothetical protein